MKLLWVLRLFYKVFCVLNADQIFAWDNCLLLWFSRSPRHHQLLPRVTGLKLVIITINEMPATPQRCMHVWWVLNGINWVRARWSFFKSICKVRTSVRWSLMRCAERASSLGSVRLWFQRQVPAISQVVRSHIFKRPRLLQEIYFVLDRTCDHCR